MTRLSEVLRASTRLAPAQVDWLHLLVGDWQLLSDLSFADLLLHVPTVEGTWLVAAHVRPNTGRMAFVDDVVGRVWPVGEFPAVDKAFATGRVVGASAPVDRDGHQVMEEAIPVVVKGSAVGVVTRHSSIDAGRAPSRLEDTYRALADILAGMLTTGEFPSASSPTGLRRGAPRVGDGVIHLDVEGQVLYASPNAISALHRLGHHDAVIGQNLATLVADLVQRSDSPVDESLALVLTGRAAWRSEVVSLGATVSMRAVPLTRRGPRVGALVLLRDVSELRRRERELLTKEATIREIHHRVKNNLQTVAALLRLQARRLPESEGKSALQEAVRRVGTIALVHETLSQGFEETVNFDDIAVRGLQAVVEVATEEKRIDSSVKGSFGRMRAEDATALAMIISELVQNAAEHAFTTRGGRIQVAVEHGDDEVARSLVVTITDDGSGLPDGFRPGTSGLGTQIVESLVSDLQGRITWSPAQPHGTRVRFTARLRPLERDGS